MSSNQKTTEVTTTHDLVTPSGLHSIKLLIAVNRSNQYKALVETIRQLVREGFKEQANKLKKQLPAFTASCQYHTRRCKENVSLYTGYVLLDADGLTQTQLVHASIKLSANPWVLAYFVSPSGRGIKVLVKTNGKQEHHAHTYKQVMSFFSRLLKIEFDAHTSDIVRLCFLSYDPGAYYNEDAWTFQVTLPEIVSPCPHPHRAALPSLGKDTADYLFKKSVRFANRKQQFMEGNRNNYIFLLSCYCRMNGLNREDALDEILQHYNFSQREIQSAVRSAYKYK